MMRLLLSILLLFAFAGCAHEARSPKAEGTSSYTFVDAPMLSGRRSNLELASENQPVDLFVEARLTGTPAKPIYPPAALKAQADLAFVGVRITVDALGRVADVSGSLISFSTPGPFAADFRAAVEAAVAQWKFEPAKRRHLEPARTVDGTAYWRNAGEEAIESTLDIAFTFGSAGEILTAPAK